MEEILRWGTQDLFQPRTDLEDAKKAVQSDTASDPPGQVEDSSTLRPDNNQAASVRTHLSLTLILQSTSPLALVWLSSSCNVEMTQVS